MKKRFLTMLSLLFLGILVTGALSAQKITVSGKVTDANDGSALIGVTIIEKGTTNGKISDVSGNYSITVAPDATLLISYVGYATQEISVNNRSTIDVAMTIGDLRLQEVVVIGYGTVAKKDATGAVAALASRDFNKGSAASPQELIVGKIPGVQITNAGGDPTASSTIRIRGGSSMSASNDPLIVIDGVPIDNSSVSGMPNALNLLNSNDIESFTVLKDASATAIYGSRASNGVILITTKKGLLNKPLKVTYDGSISIGTRTGQIDVLNASEFSEQVNAQYPAPSTAVSLLGSSDTDWQKELYQTAVSNDHNISLSGSVSVLPYRVSIGYTNQSGLLKTSKLERVTGSINLNPTFLDKHLTLTLNVKGMTIKNKFADWGAVGAAVAFDPTQPVYGSGGIFNEYFYWKEANGTPTSNATANPVSLLMDRNDQSNVNRLLGNIQVDYTAHFLPDLKATLNLGGDFSNSEGHRDVAENVEWTYDNTYGNGTKNYYTQNKKNTLLDFYLNYKKDITSIKSRIDVTAGYEWQHFYNDDTTSNSNLSGTRIDLRSYNATESYLISFFGRLNYVFADNYMLTATIREDGSSRFAKENRWGLFPSFAFAWDIKGENFLKNFSAITELKLRLGYGITGQQELNSGDYPYLARYTKGMDNAQAQMGPDFIYTLRPEGYDANLKWEETTTYNAGIDFGIIKDRLTGSLDVYSRITRDMLNTIPPSAGSNLTNRILTNVGDMINKGIELSLNVRPVMQKDLDWTLSFTGTYNKNEITKLTTSDDSTYIGVETGNTGGAVGNTIQIHTVGYPVSSFYVYKQVYDNNGKPIEGLYVDMNGDGQFTELDKYRYQKPAPDFTLGISSLMRYKKFDFSFNGRLSLGNYIYNNMSSNYGSYSELYKDFGSGFLANLNRSILETGFEVPQYWSDYYIENASFFKMDNVSLGYNFTNMVNGKGNLRLYTSVQNLFLITKYKGLDPEVFNGIDNNIYPRPRTFLFGVSFEF